jgi:hypothetical protein
MNSEVNPSDAGGSGAMANLVASEHAKPDGIHPDGVNLNREGVLAMRHSLHELANVFTGVMIAGDLLSLHLAEGPLQRYANEICSGSERGCGLVREIRGQLLAACGEVEPTLHGQDGASSQGR